MAGRWARLRARFLDPETARRQEAERVSDLLRTAPERVTIRRGPATEPWHISPVTYHLDVAPTPESPAGRFAWNPETPVETRGTHQGGGGGAHASRPITDAALRATILAGAAAALQDALTPRDPSVPGPSVRWSDAGAARPSRHAGDRPSWRA